MSIDVATETMRGCVPEFWDLIEEETGVTFIPIVSSDAGFGGVRVRYLRAADANAAAVAPPAGPVCQDRGGTSKNSTTCAELEPFCETEGMNWEFPEQTNQQACPVTCGKCTTLTRRMSGRL